MLCVANFPNKCFVENAQKELLQKVLGKELVNESTHGSDDGLS